MNVTMLPLLPPMLAAPERSLSMASSDERYADAEREQRDDASSKDMTRDAQATRESAVAPRAPVARVLELQDGPPVGRSLPLVDLMLKRLEQNPTRMTLEVEDEHLGAVAIRAFTKDGTVELAIDVSSDQARRGIECELAELHAQCDARGIRLGRTAFSIRRPTKEKRHERG